MPQRMKEHHGPLVTVLKFAATSLDSASLPNAMTTAAWNHPSSRYQATAIHQFCKTSGKFLLLARFIPMMW